jgi:hypothetical protein
VVVFAKRTRKPRMWVLSGNVIKQVNGYKYLGVDFQRSLSWSTYKTRICKKARKNLYASLAMGAQSGHLSPKASCILYQALVRSILEFGAEIWGEGNWEEGEKIQREMGKRILGVSDRTPNEVVQGELGWWSLKGRRDYLRINFWGKLVSMHEGRLARQVYQSSRTQMEQGDDQLENFSSWSRKTSWSKWA